MKFPKMTSILIAVLLFFTVLLGYNYVKRPFAKPSQIDLDVDENQASAAAELVGDESLRRWQLGALTPEQKVGQLMIVPFVFNTNTASDEASLQELLSLEPGGLLIFGSKINMIETKRLTTSVTQLQALDAIPVIIAVDHEGGEVQRLAGNGFSLLPSARDFCKQTNEMRLAELDQSAQELSLAGIHLVFGPLIDVASSSAVLKSRVCSGDPTVVGQYGNQFASAFSNAGILPVLKHYPGIGSITKDLHVSFDQQLVLAKDVVPFKTVLDAHPQIGVMVAHMGVANQIPGLPCSVSADCIDQLKSTNPQVLILSDSLTMKAVGYDGETNQYSKTLESIALSAVMAGNQLLVFGPEASPKELELVKSALVAQYSADTAFAQQVDLAVARILDAKEFQIFK